MSRSSFALLTLLTTLAGPLLFPPVARSEQPMLTCPAEAYGVHSVCTPPPSAVHPADNQGLLPNPGYEGEYADAEAEAAWRSPTPVPSEDWRDFVIENKTSSISNTYDDLFETIDNVASAVDSDLSAAVVEADVDAYQSESDTAPEYDPYAASAEVEDPEYASIEAYEAEFSGYGTTDYLRDNFDYEAVASAPFHSNSMSKVLFGWGEAALNSDAVAASLQYGSEAWFAAQQLSQEYDFDAIVDASELAWDRLEEYNRTTRRPLPLVQNEEIGYRLATDDCGWDCWFGMRANEPSPVLPPAPPTNQVELQRETLLNAAIALRHLAAQLEAASDWIATLGGIDLAEVETGATSR